MRIKRTVEAEILYMDVDEEFFESSGMADDGWEPANEDETALHPEDYTPPEK